MIAGRGLALALLLCSCSAAALHGASLATADANARLTTAEIALAAHERADVKAAIDGSTTREEADAKLLPIWKAYGAAWEAYSLARSAEIVAAEAVREGAIDSIGDDAEAKAALAALLRAEQDFEVAVKAIRP